jgi:hypothetical protein
MLDDEKCKKCFRLSKSWLGKQWSLLVKLYQQSSAFRLQWEEAATSDSNSALVWDIPTSIRALKQRRDVTEKKFHFLTVTEFINKFKMSPKALGLKITTTRDEWGTRDLKGVLILPASDPNDESLANYRVVRICHETIWGVDEELRGAKDRLRKGEPSEIFQHYNMKRSSGAKDYVLLFVYACDDIQ